MDRVASPSRLSGPRAYLEVMARRRVGRKRSERRVRSSTVAGSAFLARADRPRNSKEAERIRHRANSSRTPARLAAFSGPTVVRDRASLRSRTAGAGQAILATGRRSGERGREHPHAGRASVARDPSSASSARPAHTTSAATTDATRELRRLRRASFAREARTPRRTARAPASARIHTRFREPPRARPRRGFIPTPAERERGPINSTIGQVPDRSS
jgi:hypothetical protein